MMSTLPSNRSVNTFQNAELQPGSTSNNNLRHLRPSSLYLTNSEPDEASQNPLLPPNEQSTGPMERRAHTLGRGHTPMTLSPRNLTNPLFDSMGSLNQPWYRSYAHTATLPAPKINQPMAPRSIPENPGFATARDLQPTIRVPVPRSPSHMSASYSTSGRRMQDYSIRGDYADVESCRPARAPARPPAGSCFSTGCLCCEREQNVYSSPEDGSVDWPRTEKKKQQPPKPWIVCLLTVSTICDLFLLIVLAALVFFLNCSPDGWFYSDRRISQMCTTLWSDWIPLHRRSFRCPALPPGVDESQLDTNNPLLRPYFDQYGHNSGSRGHMNQITTPVPPGYGYPSELGDRRSQVPVVPADSGVWDADLGLMPPPSATEASRPDLVGAIHYNQRFYSQYPYGMTTTRLYGPHYDDGNQRGNTPKWINPSTPYTPISTGSIILGATVIPLIVIVCIEITAGCLNCCRPYEDRRSYRSSYIRRVIGRLYRFSITYAFGLLTVILITLILKAAIGRLRPNFIAICRPSPTVCPQWSALIQSTNPLSHAEIDPRYGSGGSSSNTQLLSILARESARQGFDLVPRTTPSPGLASRASSVTNNDFLSDKQCTEKRLLRLKYARTSFPSLGASVVMYACIFMSAYVTHTLRYLRRTCLCIPLVLLLGTCLGNVLLGLGRVVRRENWLADVVAGWALGALIAAYVLYRTIRSNKSTNAISTIDLQNQLNHIQNLLQTHNEYRQNEVKLMKYM